MFSQHHVRLSSLTALAAMALITLFSLIASGAPAAAAPAAAPARLRAVHAVANFGAVDVYVDGVAVLRDITFFSVSDYLELTPGRHLVQIIPAGEDIANPSIFIANRRATYVSGRDYTSIARGLAGKASLGTSPRDDDNTAPAFGKAKLRVAHFSPDVHDLDIFINGEKVIDPLNSNRLSNYLSLDPGTYTIGVAVSGKQPFYTTSLTLEAGQVVTAWANGLSKSRGADAFKLTPSNDASFELARVRAVHAIPDIAGSPVDVYVDDTKVVTFDFFDVTDYLPLYAGDYTVRVTLEGDDPATEAVITADVTVEGGKDYSIIARGTGGDFGATVLEDDNKQPALGQARVRAAHFSPDAPAVDVYVNGTKQISGLSFLSAAPYLSVPPGDYTLGIAPAGGSIIYTATATLEAGQVVTVWANGLLAGSGVQAFKLTPSVDAAFELARVRAVHAIPDIAGSPVDVYIDDTKVVTFDFFDVTDYLPLYAGDYTVRVTLEGDDPATEAVITADVTVEGGKDYSIIARGTGGAFGATVLEDDNKQPALGQARVRAAHFSPDAPAVDVYVNGTRQIDALSFRNASGYLNVPPGDYTLGIAPAGGSIIYTATATLEAGQVVTVWANGLLAGSGVQAFKLTPSLDASFAQAEVRLLHAVPDAPAVDIFLDGERVVAGITFGTISSYLPVSAGSYNVQIKPAGGSTVVFNGSVTFEAGKRYTAAAIGLLSGTPGINVISFEDSPVPAGAQARLRVIQLAPNSPAMDVLVEAGQPGAALRYAPVSSPQSIWQVGDKLGYADSGSIELPAGTYALSVLADQDGAELVRSRPVLGAGSSTTIFVIGNSSVDAPADQQMRLVSTGETAAEVPEATMRIYLPMVMR